MKLDHSTAIWSQGAITACAVLLAVALLVADQQRGDWIAGPSLFLLYLLSFPIHLAALGLTYFSNRNSFWTSGVAIGGMLLALQVASFILYLRGG